MSAVVILRFDNENLPRRERRELFQAPRDMKLFLPDQNNNSDISHFSARVS
jgi:hypothetical protein